MGRKNTEKQHVAPSAHPRDPEGTESMSVDEHLWRQGKNWSERNNRPVQPFSGDRSDPEGVNES